MVYSPSSSGGTSHVVDDETMAISHRSAGPVFFQVVPVVTNNVSPSTSTSQEACSSGV